MRWDRIIVTCAAAMLLGSIASTARAQTVGQTAFRDEVLSALRALDSATLRADSAALERLYADDYVFVTYRGTIESKRHQIELIKSGTMRFTERTPSELNVRLFGEDMAVVVYRRHQQATVAGAARPSDVRVTGVWLKRGGRWQIVSGQVTPIQGP